MDILSGSAPQDVAGLSNITTIFRNPYEVEPKMSSKEENPDFPVRMVEFRPAWALHALLRFRGITYLNENLPIPTSMGQTLPVIVDGHHVVDEASVMEHLGVELSKEEHEMIVWLDKELGAVTREIKRHLGTDMMEITKACGPHCPTSWELIIKDALKKLVIHDNKDNADIFKNCSTEKLKNQLKDSLSHVNSLLEKNKGYLMNQEASLALEEKEGEKRAPLMRSSAAEAVLFGHLCEIWNTSIVNDLDLKYDKAKSFLSTILEDYFQMTSVPPSLNRKRSDRESFRRVMIEWRRSTDTLLQNPFVSQLPLNCLTVSLLQQKTKYTSLNEQQEASWHRLLTFASSNGCPEHDSTNSHWSCLRFSLKPMKRTFKKVAAVCGLTSSLGDGGERGESDDLKRGDMVTIHPGGALFLTSLGICFAGYAMIASGTFQ